MSVTLLSSTTRSRFVSPALHTNAGHDDSVRLTDHSVEYAQNVQRLSPMIQCLRIHRQRRGSPATYVLDEARLESGKAGLGRDDQIHCRTSRTL